MHAFDYRYVKGGKIIGRGTHRELMRERGYYYELYTRQYEELLWGEG
jgi:ATP-binding cassette subfamily B protein